MPLIVSAVPTPPATMFVWDNPTTDTAGNPATVTGNTLYCGLTSGARTVVYPMSTAQTSALFSDAIPVDGTYFCQVTASAIFNGKTIEGVYSNEYGPFTLSGGVVQVVGPAAPTGLSARLLLAI